MEDTTSDHADGVGELLHGRNDGQQSTLSQRAVADLAASGAAGRLGLTDGVAGEVVVVHVALLGLFPDGVQLLVGGQSVQRADGQHLRLAAGEQAGAVDTGQHAHLGVQRTDLVLLTAIHAMTLQQPLLHDHLLELVGDLLQVLIHVGVLFQVLVVPLLDHGVPALLADVLVISVHGGLGLVHKVGGDLVEQLVVEVGVGVLELGLADLLHHLIDEGDLLLVLLMGLLDGLEHHGVWDLVGAGLDHDDLLAGGDDGHVQVGDLTLLAIGVDHQLAVHQAHLQERPRGRSRGCRRWPERRRCR